MSATVLVVEDDEMVAQVIQLGLEAQQFTVIHAPTPEAGVAAAAQTRPDLVLLGVSRIEVAGWEALERIRSEAGIAEVPVILMSSRTLPADQVRGYSLGVTGYLSKPFSAEELLETVREALPATA